MPGEPCSEGGSPGSAISLFRAAPNLEDGVALPSALRGPQEPLPLTIGSRQSLFNQMVFPGTNNKHTFWKQQEQPVSLERKENKKLLGATAGTAGAARA